MKLVSMKREEGDYGMECPGVSRFGYGLMINLDEDQCEALGIAKAIRPGTQVSIKGIGIVVRASECLESDGDDAGPVTFRFRSRSRISAWSSWARSLTLRPCFTETPDA